MWILRSAQRGTRSPVEENNRGPLRCARWLIRSATLLLAAGALLAQHAYTAADIEDGGRLFRGSCVTCHGVDGNLVPGVDLMHGKFRRAASDEGVIEIIRKGISGTAMIPQGLSEVQAGDVVAYLRSMALTLGAGVSLPGDRGRGKAIFEGKGACLSCHRVLAAGSRVGPDLTEIGALRRASQLETSLTDPDAEVLPQNRSVRVVTKDGATFTGRLLNLDTFHVQILDSKEQMRTFDKSRLREFTVLDKSAMPSYRGKLSAPEIADVVAYLASLKGIDKQ